MQDPRAVALIPARAGSKRVPGKNVRPLAGHPLLAYTVAAARESRVFEAVVVSTDAESVARVARHYGAEAPFLRPPALAGDHSPDIEWVRHALDSLDPGGRRFHAFALLRPTSPFRQASTIRRAWDQFCGAEGADSIRAVEPCRQHPGKMWTVEKDRLRPLLPQPASGTPLHSRPYQSLPLVYAQNASLEIAWARVVRDTGTISGTQIAPFLTQGREGFDINDENDWLLAETWARGEAGLLPRVGQTAFAEAAA